jgi:parallel beta-helix repeat protein
MRYAYVCILPVFFLSVFLSVLPGSAGAQACAPPASGDWLVNETVVCSGQSIVLNGSLLVNGTGNLTLKDSTLSFNSASDGQFGAEVNGSLYVLSSGIENASDKAYTFVSNAGANLTVRNSHVYGCGFASSDIKKMGVYVSSAGANITNTTFADNYFALMLYAGNGNVSKNLMASNYLGLVAEGPGNFIYGNAIIGNSGGAAVNVTGNNVTFYGNVIENNTGAAPSGMRLNNSLVNNNSLFNNTGGGLRISGDSNNVTGNRITYNSNTGLDAANSQNTRITGNTILGNEKGLYISYSRDTLVSDSLCNMSSQYDVSIISSPNITFGNVNYTTLIRKWRLNVRVWDNAGNPVTGASVVIKNNYTAIVYSGTTNSTGSIPQLFLDERKENQSVLVYNPYSLNVSGDGYYSNYTLFSLTGDLSADVIIPLAQVPMFSVAVNSPKNETYMRYNLSAGGMLPLAVSSESNISLCNYSVGNIFGPMVMYNQTYNQTMFQAFLNASNLSGTYRIVFSCKSSENISASSGISFTVYPAYECAASSDCGGTQTCTASKCQNLECVCGHAQNHACVNYECCADTDCKDDESCNLNLNSHTCLRVSCECPEKRSNHKCNMGVYCCKDLQCKENETCVNHGCVTKSLSIVVPGELAFGRNVTVKVLDQDKRPAENVRVDVKYLDTDPVATGTYYTGSNGTAEIEIKHAGRVAFVARKGGYFTGNSQGEVPKPLDLMFLTEIIVLIAASVGIVITAFKIFRARDRGEFSSEKGPLRLEKSVSGTTVMLHVVNRTKKKLEDIAVRDSVPAGAFIQGAIMPKIEPLDDRTNTLTWEILQLGPNEEVTIEYETYHANPGFSVNYKGKEYRG